MQGRINDVDASQDRRTEARTDQTARKRGARPARHRTGFTGSPFQMQQVRLECGHSEICGLDDRVRILLMKNKT